MAKELFNSDFYTLPEQVQINKEDIKTNTDNIATNTANIATNTSDITKLQDDIGKIKPNAWEERKFKLNFGATAPAECSTYNPITNESNPMVNIQRAFTDKDTYDTTDVINSSSFSVSIPTLKLFIYNVCADPTLTLLELADMEFNNNARLKNKIVFIDGADEDGNKIHSISINCDTAYIGKLSFHRNDSVDDITRISDDDDKSDHSLLTAKAVDQYYLKKTDASNTYLTKTDASNTYVTKQEYEKRIDEGTITFTSQGWEKLRAITDTEGQTITLRAGVDYIEHIQITWNHDAILQFRYDNNFIYKNVYLHPNSSLDDLDDPNGHNSQQVTFYTGQAIFTLATQSDALFNIIFQEGGSIILHLITTM